MAKSVFRKLVKNTNTKQSQKVSKQLISKLSKPKSVCNKTSKSVKPINYKSVDHIIGCIDDNLIIRILQAIDERRCASMKLDLLDRPQPIFISFTTYDMIIEPQVRPLFIKVPNSIYLDKDICVIVKDPHESWKEAFKSANIPQIKKIIGLKKLKTRYREYKNRRELCDSYDLFICDKAIVPSMPSALGKYFIEKKKLPIAYKFDKLKLPEIINKLLSYVYFRRSAGPSR